MQSAPSEMKIRTYVRKKKLIFLEKNDDENKKKHLCSRKKEGLPDIEEFAYKKPKKIVDSAMQCNSGGFLDVEQHYM